MSLVNKMLRDLDARRAGANERGALPAAVTPLPARAENPFPAIPVAALLAALVAVGAWYAWPEAEKAPPVAAAIPAPGQSIPPALASSASPPDAPSPGAEPELRLAMELTGLSPSALPAASRPSASSVSPPPLVKPAGAPAVSAPSAPPSPAAVASSAAAPASAPAPRPPVTALPREVPALAEGSIEKHVRLPSPAERAEADFRRGLQAQRQGLAEEAVARYRAALAASADHAAARQNLAALLIELRRFDDADEVLRQGVELGGSRLASTLALARLKVERGQVSAALDLLLAQSAAGERSADFQGFTAALLNRAGRHREAVERYQAAARLAPADGRWWVGLGIALDGDGRGAEANEAYLRARNLPGLPPELARHVEQRLR